MTAAGLLYMYLPFRESVTKSQQLWAMPPCIFCLLCCLFSCGALILPTFFGFTLTLSNKASSSSLWVIQCSCMCKSNVKFPFILSANEELGPWLGFHVSKENLVCVCVWERGCRLVDTACICWLSDIEVNKFNIIYKITADSVCLSELVFICRCVELRQVCRGPERALARGLSTQKRVLTSLVPLSCAQMTARRTTTAHAQTERRN